MLGSLHYICRGNYLHPFFFCRAVVSFVREDRKAERESMPMMPLQALNAAVFWW